MTPAPLSYLTHSCLPIRAPTVPEGSERLRIILHAHNSEEEVKGLCRAIKKSLDLLHDLKQPFEQKQAIVIEQLV